MLVLFDARRLSDTPVEAFRRISGMCQKEILLAKSAEGPGSPPEKPNFRSREAARVRVVGFANKISILQSQYPANDNRFS